MHPDSARTVFVINPQMNSDPSKPTTYYKYCYLALLRLKPWHTFPEHVIINDDNEPRGTCDDLNKISDDLQHRLVESWNAFRDNVLQGDAIGHVRDDFFQREVDRMRNPIEQQEALMDEGFLQSQEEGDAFSPDDQQPEFADLYNSMCQRPFEDDMDAEMEWTTDNNFNIPNNDYKVPQPNNPNIVINELTITHIKTKWKELDETNPPMIRTARHLNDLSDSQRQPVTVWLSLMGLWKDANGNFLPPTQPDEDNLAPNVMIIGGPAGTGKSFIIDCMVTEALERMEEKSPAPPGNPHKIKVMAPTGRAAMASKGVTLHSREGLSIPTTNITDVERNMLSSQSLLNLQTRMKNVIGVIIDEYSMVNL